MILKFFILHGLSYLCHVYKKRGFLYSIHSQLVEFQLCARHNVRFSIRAELFEGRFMESTKITMHGNRNLSKRGARGQFS